MKFSGTRTTCLRVLKWMSEKQVSVTTKALAESENVIEAIFKLLSSMTAHFQ